MKGGGLRSSTAAKGLAVFAAVGVHAAIGWSVLHVEGVEIESAQGTDAARVGSFADLSAGTVRSTPTESTIEASRRPARPAQPVEAERAARPAPTASRSPDAAANRVQNGRNDRVAPVQSERTLSSIAPTETARAPDGATEAEPLQTDRARVQAAVPDDRITASAPDSAAVERSLRPVRRSADVEARRTRARDTPRRDVHRPETDAGVAASRPSRSGLRDGQRDAASETRGRDGQSNASPGSAAASNYPGRIQAKLARTRQPSAAASGTVRVRLTVSGTGGIASLGILTSSGNRAADQAALRFVQSAAPFPAPPVGAQRIFDIPVTFKR